MYHIEEKPMTDFTDEIFSNKIHDLSDLQRSKIICELANSLITPFIWPTEKVVYFQNLALIKLASSETISVMDLFKRYKGIVFEPDDTDTLNDTQLADYDAKRIAVIHRSISQLLTLNDYLTTAPNNPKERELTLQVIFSRFLGSITSFYLTKLSRKSSDQESYKPIYTYMNQWIDAERAKFFVCDPNKKIVDLVHDYIDNTCESHIRCNFFICEHDRRSWRGHFETHFIFQSFQIHMLNTIKLINEGKERFASFIKRAKNDSMHMLSLFNEPIENVLEIEPIACNSLLIGVHPYEVTNTSLLEYKERMHAVVEKFIEMDA